MNLDFKHPYEQHDDEVYLGNFTPDQVKVLKAAGVPIRLGIVCYNFTTGEPLEGIGLSPVFLKKENIQKYRDVYDEFVKKGDASIWRLMKL